LTGEHARAIRLSARRVSRIVTYQSCNPNPGLQRGDCVVPRRRGIEAIATARLFARQNHGRAISVDQARQIRSPQPIDYAGDESDTMAN
jgi:hypothetical protein